MEHFFEALMELVFGLAKEKPAAMPELEYREEFTVKHSAKKTLLRIAATLAIILIFSVLWLLVKREERALFAAFAVMGALLFLLSLFSFSFVCEVSREKLCRKIFWVFTKEMSWEDVVCVRIAETTGERDAVIALYGRGGNCEMDFDTGMENAWYLIKAAEHRGIEIRKEKDLTLSQLRRL